MKTIIVLFLSLIVTNLSSQSIAEKEVKSEVKEVTVFLEGAQVVRKQSVDLTNGQTIIKFLGLSPFIDAKSIQVKAGGELTVLSVNHQQNYLDKIEKSAELIELEKKLAKVDEEINIENTYISIIKEELAFLQENRNIGGKNEQVSVSNLQLASKFYSEQLTSLKMRQIERIKVLTKLNEQKEDLQNQIKLLTNKKSYPSAEVLIKVDAKKAGKHDIELSYMVGNAGWFPSYDIRAKNIDEPIQLIYKANVKQDTKEDWKNVKLKFSSAKPNVSGVAPELQTYYLNYNTVPPVYKLSANSVRGKVMDSNGDPLIGASVVVEGTTIGTVTDMEGNYSITIPQNAGHLTFTFIGFITKTLPINNNVLNVTLVEHAQALEDLEVVAYGTVDALQGKISGLDVNSSQIRIRGTSSSSNKAVNQIIPAVQVENQTSVDFEIESPYTIASDNKNYVVDMAYYNLPAIYKYYAVPKIDKDAFLIAHIIDWEKYNLLEAEANIFFEDTYVGKTLMDVRFASDTLEISLGRDKKVSVNREKIKDYSLKQFIGSKKEEVHSWKTTVKNNKNQTITMIVLDQIPVSTNSEIEVKPLEITTGKHNEETGEIKWELELQPNDTRELELRYSVRYPKNRNVIVD